MKTSWTGASLPMPPDVATQAQERGWARDLDETVKELLVELKEQQGLDTL